MSALAFTAGAVTGGIVWGLISYWMIRAFLDIEDHSAEQSDETTTQHGGTP